MCEVKGSVAYHISSSGVDKVLDASVIYRYGLGGSWENVRNWLLWTNGNVPRNIWPHHYPRIRDSSKQACKTLFDLLYTDRSLDEDEDDLNEQDIPSFTAPSLSSPVIDKGKARAPDPVAQTSSAGAPSQGVSGNISTSNAPHKPARQTVSGIRVETRCVSFVWFGHSTESHLGIDTRVSTLLMSP